MFCKYCGKVIDDDSVFCDGCGKNLKETGAKTVYVPTTVKDNSYKTAPEASPKTQYTQPVKPNPVPQQSNDYTQAPRVEEKPQHFQQPVIVNPTPAQKAEIPDTPLTKKKSIVPYILLPIAVIIAALVNTAMPLLTSLIEGYLINNDFFGTDNFLTGIAFSSFSSSASGILPTLFVLVLFSLCCKGFNKKVRFISSFYAAGVGRIISTIISVIAGYIILYAVGFHDRESSNIYSGVVAVCELLTMLILLPLLASLWFAFSEKYTVNKEENTSPGKIVLPCILLGVYGLINLGIIITDNTVNIAFVDLFGEYSFSFATKVTSLITESVSLILLFLFALACEGGYRKLAFVGSILFSNAIFAGVWHAFGLFFSIISDGESSMYTLGNYIGIGVQTVLVITLSIVLYILMNRYVIEKIEKEKA